MFSSLQSLAVLDMILCAKEIMHACMQIRDGPSTHCLGGGESGSACHQQVGDQYNWGLGSGVSGNISVWRNFDIYRDIIVLF